MAESGSARGIRIHTEFQYVYVSKCLRECHWTQGMEDDLNSVHAGFLHAEVFGRWAKFLNHASARSLTDNPTPPGMNPKDYRQRPLSCVLPRGVASWTEAVADAIDIMPETFRASV